MRIDHNAHGNAEARAQYDVGCLAPHARKFDEGVEFARNLAAMLANEVAAQTLKAFGLVVEKVDALDQILDARQSELGQGLGCRCRRKKCGCDHVHACIGALGREHCGDEQLKGAVVHERASGFGKFLPQATDDAACSDAALS